MLVSVLMPVFNGAGSLGEAVSSILAQTLDDIELIIVNDGSTDGTSEVARSFADPRVRVIHLPANKGIVNALNVGLSEARGEYLARMDHDDVAHPLRLQRQVEAMVNCGAVICGSAIQPFGAIRGKPMSYPVADGEIRAALPVVSPFAHPAVTMRLDVCRKLGYAAAAKHYEDYDLWWRIAGEGKMMNLPDPLLRYRFHRHQISAAQRPAQLDGMATVAADNLRRSGRFRTVSDLECHKMALSYLSLKSLAELEYVGEWLAWLRNSFGDAGNSVSGHYLRVWRGVCARQPHLGHGLWRVYRRFRPPVSSAGADALVFLTAYGGLGQDSRVLKLSRRLLRR